MIADSSPAAISAAPLAWLSTQLSIPIWDAATMNGSVVACRIPALIALRSADESSVEREEAEDERADEGHDDDDDQVGEVDVEHGG